MFPSLSLSASGLSWIACDGTEKMCLTYLVMIISTIMWKVGEWNWNSPSSISLFPSIGFFLIWQRQCFYKILYLLVMEKWSLRPIPLYRFWLHNSPCLVCKSRWDAPVGTCWCSSLILPLDLWQEYHNPLSSLFSSSSSLLSICFALCRRSLIITDLLCSKWWLELKLRMVDS